MTVREVVQAGFCAFAILSPTPWGLSLALALLDPKFWPLFVATTALVVVSVVVLLRTVPRRTPEMVRREAALKAKFLRERPGWWG